MEGPVPQVTRRSTTFPGQAVEPPTLQPPAPTNGEKKKKRPKSAIGKLQIMVKKFFYAGVALSLAIFWYMPLIVQLFVVGLGLGVVALVYLPKKVPHRWELKFMVAQGFTLGQWFGYLVRHRFHLDPVYWHRALFITILACFNTFSWVPTEEKEYPEERIRKTEIKNPPIFILGHFRSGTSHLHELMSKDKRFVAPTVFQCFAPRVFLSREEAMNKTFGNLSLTRPMDAMKIKFESPQEDEFGLINLCGLSPYMGALFGASNSHYLKYLSFKECTPEEIATWKDTVLFFYKKVLLKKPEKTLILKSPAHTARLKLLHELFPEAKFVHISRNPYEIYQSTKKLFRDLLIQWNLQFVDYDDEDELHTSILRLYGGMYDSFFQDRDELNLRADQLCYVSYEDLVQRPTEVLRKIYTDLKLGGFEEIEPLLVKEEEAAKAFTKNTHKAIDPKRAADVRTRLAKYFSSFNYPLEPPAASS